MNWTGGSLQRHSKKSAKNTANRQRQHFAKARTGLQNGTKSPLIPFRPSYLHEGDDGRSGQLPSFGLRSVQHTDDLQNLQERGETRCSPPSPSRSDHNAKGARGSAADAAHRPRPLSLYNSASLIGHARGRPIYADRGKSIASDTEIETELLEANRQRLLLREDWLGLAPLRPVNMAFASIREKGRIGRRRKLDRRDSLQQNAKAASARPTAVNIGDYHHPARFTSAAVRDQAGGIRIQIGMDALASQTPMQLSDHAPSHTPEISQSNSSGPMLFDHEELYSAHIQPNQTSRSVSVDRVESPRSLERTHRHSQHPSVQGDRQRLPRPSSHQRATPGWHDVLSPPQLGRSGATEHGQNLYDSVQAHVPANARRQNEGIGPGVLIKQHIGGVGGRPIRLVFDQTSDKLGNRDDAVGVMQEADVHDSQTRRGANAGIRESGQGDGEEGHERTSASEVPAHPSIDDDAPWRSFVEVPEVSSTSSNTSRPALSRTPKGPVKNGSPTSGPTNWSPHVTRGGGTGIDTASSSISVSLPPIRHTDERGILQAALQAPIHRGHTVTRRQSHAASRSEELWRTFVFESDDSLASETDHEDADDVGVGPRRTSSRRNWSGPLASCVAVASPASSRALPHTF